MIGNIPGSGAIIKIPFNGYIETSFTGTNVAYSKLSLSAYLAQDCTLKAISWDEYQRLRTEYYYLPFEQITTDAYDAAFSELPPKRCYWLSARFHIFYCSEALSGEFHALYVYDAKRETCYQGTKSILLSDEEILQGIEKEISLTENNKTS